MADTKKLVMIYVEGKAHEWPKDDITYADVVRFEVPDFEQHPEVTYTVKYTKGQGNKPEGILAPGGLVKVKDGMVFSVSATGQS